MTIETIKTVGVLGAGGDYGEWYRARVCAPWLSRDFAAMWRSGFSIAGLRRLPRNLDREVKKGKLSEDEKLLVVARIKPVTDVAALADADFVVEDRA